MSLTREDVMRYTEYTGEQFDMWDYFDEQIEKDLLEDYEQLERDMYSLNQYQADIADLIITEGETRLMENTLGLVGEAGEVAEKIKKHLRDGYLKEEDLMKELGDVLFYVAALADYFDTDLSEVAMNNKDKLYSRKERGVLKGEGDNR